MSKKRDAATGLYISDEESKTKDKTTWVEEKDKPKFGMDDRTHLLVSLYVILKNSAYHPEDNNNLDKVVSLDDIKEAFKLTGCDIDKLQKEGKISIE